MYYGSDNGIIYKGKAYSTGIGSAPKALAIGDFNNDSRLDFAVANYLTNEIGVFIGYGSELLGNLRTYTINSKSQPYAVATGNFNNDSGLDIVVTNYGTNNVYILFGDGDGIFDKIIKYSTGDGSAPCSVAVGDFINDNQSDIVVATCETDNLAVLLNNGNDTFTVEATYSTGARSRPSAVVIAEFNNDNMMDIGVANSGTNNVLLLYGHGNGTFGNKESYPLGYGYRPYSIAVQDLNQDSWVDIVIACYGTDNVEILMKMC